MQLSDRYALEGVDNLGAILEGQREKMEALREAARGLEFVPVDPAGSYSAVTFKSFDGGMSDVSFDAFEFDIVEVADSNGNSRLRFAAPGGDLLGTEGLDRVIDGLDANPVIRRFLGALGRSSLRDVTDSLTDRGTLMEIGEFACMLDKAMSAPEDDRTIILRDGLLRTRKIRPDAMGALRDRLAERRAHVRAAGVAKSSRVLFLLKTALLCERVFPRGRAGYVEVPPGLERLAYGWGRRAGAGMPRAPAGGLGRLYIAKLARESGVLVTVEVPADPAGDPAYSWDDVNGLMGYLSGDSEISYPVIGYPQTIMKAHEFAAGLGMPASILRDRIMGRMLAEYADPAFAEYVRDSAMYAGGVEKGVLGGRA